MVPFHHQCWGCLIPEAETRSQETSKFHPIKWVSLDTGQFLIPTTKHKASYISQLTQGAGNHDPKATHYIVVKNRTVWLLKNNFFVYLFLAVLGLCCCAGRLHFLSIVPFGEGNGNPLQCSCLENPMDRGAWWATVYGAAKSQIQLSS